MNIFQKGNIFSQIRQYFSKPKPAPEAAMEEEKERVKLDEQESGVKFGKESQGTSIFIQNTRRRLRRSLDSASRASTP